MDSYFVTTVLPKGAKLACAILKHAIPHGMPIIVQHQITPAIAELRASQKPANAIHKRLRKAVHTPAFCDATSFFPNGQKANPAIRKQATPNGIPIIVTLQRIPIDSQASPSQTPPNANHNKFPRKTIASQNALSNNCEIFLFASSTCSCSDHRRIPSHRMISR